MNHDNVHRRSMLKTIQIEVLLAIPNRATGKVPAFELLVIVSIASKSQLEALLLLSSTSAGDCGFWGHVLSGTYTPTAIAGTAVPLHIK